MTLQSLVQSFDKPLFDDSIDGRIVKKIVDRQLPFRLREQFQHNMRVRDMVTEVNQLVANVESARQRLKNASGPAADTLRRLDALRAKLVTPPIRYSKPELQAHIQYLSGMTMRADQKVGRDALERADVLRKELDEATAAIDRAIGPVPRME